MAPRTLIAILLVAVLSACAPSTEEINTQMDNYWMEMSTEEQADMCDAYFLFGPENLERMMQDSLGNFAEGEGISEDEASRRINVLVSKAGEECL